MMLKNSKEKRRDDKNRKRRSKQDGLLPAKMRNGQRRNQEASKSQALQNLNPPSCTWLLANVARDAHLKRRSPSNTATHEPWVDGVGNISRANGLAAARYSEARLSIARKPLTPAVANPGAWRGLDRCLGDAFCAALYVQAVELRVSGSVWPSLGAVRDVLGATPVLFEL